MADLTFTVNDGGTIVFTISDAAPVQFKIEKFSRTAQAGYTTLTANQLAGSAVIPTAFTYRPDALQLLRNGITMERDADFTEASDRTGFTFTGSYDSTDKFEARYVKA